jgi:hypothetical protein
MSTVYDKHLWVTIYLIDIVGILVSLFCGLE